MKITFGHMGFLIALGAIGCTQQPAAEVSTETTISNPTGATYTALDSKPRVTYRDFAGELTDSQVQEWVRDHQQKVGERAGNYKYVYIPDALRKDRKSTNYARVGIAKAINSVAPDNDDIVCPEEASDGFGVVFAVDLSKYWGSQAGNKWQIVANASVQQATGATPTLDLRRFNANAPVSADRFAYNLLHGGVYNRLIDTPAYASNLKRDLSAREVTHRIAVVDAITYSPRYAQRRQLPGGLAYWESFDDFDSDDRQLVYLTRKRNNPVPSFRQDGMLSDFGNVASETWHHLKNGIPAWYIWGNANQRRVRAEQIFVRDPFNHKDRYLITGWCQFCHVAGVQAAPSDMAYAIEDGFFTGRALDIAKQTWSTNEELAKIYEADKEVVRKAFQKLTLCMSDGDELFNQEIIYNSGRDQIEPTWFLVSNINGHPSKGSTNGLRRRVITRTATPEKGRFD